MLLAAAAPIATRKADAHKPHVKGSAEGSSGAVSRGMRRAPASFPALPAQLLGGRDADVPPIELRIAAGMVKTLVDAAALGAGKRAARDQARKGMLVFQKLL